MDECECRYAVRVLAACTAADGPKTNFDVALYCSVCVHTSDAN